MNDGLQLMQILTNLPLLAMVLARITGLVAFAPFFSSTTIPIKTRALLAFAITIIVLPFASAKMAAPSDLGDLLIGMVGELLIGLVFGLMTSTLFSGLELAGILIGQQMGISLAQVFDPLFEEENSVLGQLYFWLAMVIFLLINGHMILISALVKSFQTVPPGKFVVGNDVVASVAGILQMSFILALQVSAPIMVAIFLTTLATAFIGRTMPQLNILSVGFSLRVLLGFILIIFCMSPLVQVFFAIMEKAYGALYGLMKF